MSFLVPTIADKGLLHPIQNNVRVITEREKSRATLLVILAFFIIILNVPRCWMGNFWLDEVFSIETASLPLESLCLRDPPHPPLYYLVLSATIKITGYSYFSFHLPSLICMGIMLFTCASFVYYQFGFIASILTTVMCCSLTSASYYSVDVRMYEMAMVFTFLSFLSFYAIIEYDRKIDWILLVLFSLIAANTHYFSLIGIGLLYAMLFVYMYVNKDKNNGLIKIKKATIISILLFTPTIILLLRGANSVLIGSWTGRESYTDFLNFIKYVFDPWGLILLSLLVVLSLAIVKRNSNRNTHKEKTIFGIIKNANKESTIILCGLIVVFGTIITILLMSVFIKSYFRNGLYLYPICGIAWLLLAVSISKINKKIIKKYSPAIFMTSIAIIAFSFTNTYIDEKNQWESTERILDCTKEIDSGDILITDDPGLKKFDRCKGVLFFYYPQATSYYDYELKIPSLDPDTQYWIFSKKAITEKTFEELEIQHYTAKYIVNGSFADKYYTYVYKIIPIY